MQKICETNYCNCYVYISWNQIFYRWNINGTYEVNQNMQNRTMSELHTDDKKSLYSRNPNHMLESVKNFYEKLYTKETDFQNCHC